MRIQFLIIFIGISLGCFAQSSPRQYLFTKADSLLSLEEYDQARYHYLLALKQEGDSPSDEEIKQEVIHLDHVIAYLSDDEVFLKKIRLGDSLLDEKKWVEALKAFDDASSIQPKYDYPRARIDQILNESEEIKKKLLVYNAKQNQLSYIKLKEDIQSLEEQGFVVEAYYRYKEFAVSFHGDSMATKKAEELFEQYKQEITSFNKLVSKGEELYQKGKFEGALKQFEKAKELNPKCKTCEVRLSQIDYCVVEQIGKKGDVDKLFDEAKKNFDEGKYEKSYYQFSWLQQLDPSNEEVAEYVSSVENLLFLETDLRMQKFNADITLEKANDAFLEGAYDKALTNYLKLKNAYSEVIDYLQFVELRIAECLNELE